MNDLEKVLKEIHDRIEVHEKDYKTFEDIPNIDNSTLTCILIRIDELYVVEDIIKKYIEKESNDDDCNNIDCDSDDVKLHPDDIFDDDDVQFEENEGIVGWGKW